MAQSVEVLREAIAKDTHIPLEDMRLFLAKEMNGEWVRFWGGHTDGALALLGGETTENVMYMLVGAPDKNNIHLLVASPAIEVLAVSIRRWKSMVTQLKLSGDPRPAPRTAWVESDRSPLLLQIVHATIGSLFGQYGNHIVGRAEEDPFDDSSHTG